MKSRTNTRSAHIAIGLMFMFMFMAGCKGQNGHADEQVGACEAPLVPIYTSPGCGQDVRASCLGGAGACASFACSCDGKVIGTCNGYSSQKYQYVFETPSPDPQSCKPAQNP